jgi:membrane fusion protein, multidrug efflux system
MTFKKNNMQSFIKITAAGFLALTIAACGSSSKEEKGELGDKKAKLEKLKKDQENISSQITKLETDIAKTDPNATKSKEKLVSLTTIGTGSFNHYIDLQGKIDAQNVVYVAPRGQGGVVKAVYVKSGSRVSKGQLLLKLDNALASQSVVAAQQQISGIKAQVEQAQSIYQRQQNLWKQNIGTEIQVLNAKTNVEALQSQLRAAQANVSLAQEQANQSNVYAEISGVVDEVNIKVGEFFSPQSAAAPNSGIRIVNSANLKIMVQVPENYLGRVKEGADLLVTLPEANNKTITTKVNVAGKFIDATSRSFSIEGKLPADKDLRPNQIAVVRIQDYAAANAITIPVNTLQNDEKGKFVMVAATEGGRQVAKKRPIVIGELYGDKLEVKSGLATGDALVTEGFQNLYDGQPITTTVK